MPGNLLRTLASDYSGYQLTDLRIRFNVTLEQACCGLVGIVPIGNHARWSILDRRLGFVRLWTNPQVFANPMPVDLAASHVESWLGRHVVAIVQPGPRHAALVFNFLRSEGKGGNLTTDAHLAALAVESRGIIYTADPDFVRFSGVKWRNPLA